MDAASNVAKRNVLAGHLREVIDGLEQKASTLIVLRGAPLMIYYREIRSLLSTTYLLSKTSLYPSRSSPKSALHNLTPVRLLPQFPVVARELFNSLVPHFLPTYSHHFSHTSNQIVH
jgi:hypothetical protein